MGIDKNTGLPELPEGYFWRIKKSLLTGDMFTDVQVRKRWGFLSYKVDEQPIYNYEVSADSIRRAAYYLMQYGDVFGEKETIRRGFLGDYPPKSLNG